MVEGDKASMEPAGTGKAGVTFRCDTETFVLIAFGRLTTDLAIAADRLTILGDHSLALEFQRWFPGAQAPTERAPVHARFSRSES